MIDKEQQAIWNTYDQHLSTHHEAKDQKNVFEDIRHFKMLLMDKYIKWGTNLEIGCGNGEYINQNADVIGLDYAPALLESLKVKMPSVPVVCADSCEIPLKSKSINCVYSYSTLYYIKHISKCLEEIRRILVPGGIAILEFGNSNSLNDIASRYVNTGVKSYHISNEFLMDMVRAKGFLPIMVFHLQFFPMWTTPNMSSKDRVLNELLKSEMADGIKSQALKLPLFLDAQICRNYPANYFAFRYIAVLENVGKERYGAATNEWKGIKSTDLDKWNSGIRHFNRMAGLSIIMNAQHEIDIVDGLSCLIGLLKEMPDDFLTVLAIAHCYEQPEMKARAREWAYQFNIKDFRNV